MSRCKVKNGVFGREKMRGVCFLEDLCGRWRVFFFFSLQKIVKSGECVLHGNLGKN